MESAPFARLGSDERGWRRAESLGGDILGRRSDVPDEMDESSLEKNEKPSADTPELKKKGAEADKKDEKGRKLTPEEQLAAYEEALKNEDWGHQPC